MFSAELHGDLAPCGCSEGMRGGIARAAQQLALERAAARVFYIDTGDALFGATSLAPEAVPQQRRKAVALAEAMKRMQLWARAPGPLDDALGADFRAGLALPELRSGEVRWLDAGPARVAVAVGPAVPDVETLAQQARAHGAAFVVGLVAQGFGAAVADARRATALDLVVARAADGVMGEASHLAGDAPKVAQLQTRGRSMLRVELRLGGAGRVQWLEGSAERERELALLDQRIELMRAQLDEVGLADARKQLMREKLEELGRRRRDRASAPADDGARSASAATMSFVPLDPGLPESSEVASIVAAYDRDVGALNLAWAEAHRDACVPADLDRQGFVGSQACVGCHRESAAVWAASKHTHAYAALKHVGKQLHLDCIGCHVTGWRRPGGVCQVDDVEGRDEVGCEACHGPGWRHTQLPEVERPPRAAEAAVCTGCHDPENSPHFEHARYLEGVLGPGHGRPLADGGVARGQRRP